METDSSSVNGDNKLILESLQFLPLQCYRNMMKSLRWSLSNDGILLVFFTLFIPARRGEPGPQNQRQETSCYYVERQKKHYFHLLKKGWLQAGKLYHTNIIKSDTEAECIRLAGCTLSLPVIVLDDVTHCPDGFQILIIAFRVDIVEGLRRAGITIRACEVNGNLAPVRERIRYEDKIWGSLREACVLDWNYNLK